MSPEQAREIAVKAGELVLTAPAKPSQWANKCLVDRVVLDELAALVKAVGFDLDKARVRMKEIEAKRRRDAREAEQKWARRR